MSTPIINPFLKTQINSAWEKPIDVESINNLLTDQIIRTTQNNDQGSIVQMLIGAPGSGKTHLLTRIWKQSLLSRQFLFVSIPPPGDISRINLHFLREFISSLLEQGDKDTLSPLDLFLTETLRNILIKTLPQEQQSIIEKIKNSKSEDLYRLLTKSENRSVFINHSLSHFNQVYPNIDIQLSQALFALLDPFRKAYALKWFQGGELTEQEKQSLNIGTKLIDENSAIALTKSLISLSPLPVIITIDQMESTFYRFKKEGLVQLLDNSIALLQNDAKLFLLYIVQTQEWIDNIRSLLPRYIIDRISKIMTIKPLNLKESYDLTALRLNKFQMSVDTVFLNQKEFYPFSRDFISKSHSFSGGNPRKLLNLLRDAFDLASSLKFNPNWEKEYENQEIQRDSTVDSISVEEFNAFFDSTLKNEISSIDLPRFSLEKLRELERGVFLQIISESLAIKYLKTIPKESIEINRIVNEVTFDIIVDFKEFSSMPIGILFANQKNILFFQGILEQVLTISDFSKIIIFRSESLKSVDVTPAVKNSIKNLSSDNRIIFNYISTVLESDIIASKRLLDGSKDFTIRSINMTPELVLWYVILHFSKIENAIDLFFDSESITLLSQRLHNRITQSIMQISHSSTKSIKQWQATIRVDNLAIVTNQGQGLEIGVIFSYLSNGSLSWGMFRGSSLTSLKTFISSFINQLHIDWDPYSTFVFASDKNITGLLETSMSDIVTQYGHGIHLTQQEELTIPLESSVLGFIAYFRDIFSNVLPDKPLTPESLLKVVNLENIPINFISSLAQLLGHLFNVTFRNGQVYSLSSKSFTETTEPVTQASVAQTFDKQKEEHVHTLQAQRDVLELAEEKGDIQRIYDETIIELTNRIQKFNLVINPDDYEILTAILNYSKISPDTLTPLIKGLVTEFGDMTQKSSFKTINRQLSLEDIELQILSNYMPFKEKWAFIKSMPPLIGKLGSQFFSTGYRLNAFTLLDFHNIQLNQNWHELISRSTKSFVKTNIEIQQLSETYYSQKFESESKSLLLPIVNRYQTLILEETELLEKKYTSDSEARTNDYLDLSRHISEWWMILEAFNRVVGFEFHLDNMQFMDEILLRFENEFKDKKVNYISTDPFNFTILFENALELMSMDSDRLLQTIETRSRLALVQVDLYKTLLKKQYQNAPESITDEYSFWQCFYLVQSDVAHINEFTSSVLNNLQNLSEGYEIDNINIGIILLQLSLPALVMSRIKSEQKALDLQILIYSHALAKRSENITEVITNILVHLIEMSLLLPKEEQGASLTEISLDKIKSIYPYSVPFLKPIDKNKVKIRHNFTKLLGSKLPALLTGKITLNALHSLGFELKEQKEQKEGTRFTFRAMLADDMNVELQMMIVPSANEKSVIQLATGWDAKNIEDIELANQVIISTIIMNLVIEKEYLTLEDRAFVVHCSGCGYQINILKTKIQLFVVQCKNCSTENIIAPNVYKITSDVLR